MIITYFLMVENEFLSDFVVTTFEDMCWTYLPYYWNFCTDLAYLYSNDAMTLLFAWTVESGFLFCLLDAIVPGHGLDIPTLLINVISLMI